MALELISKRYEKVIEGFKQAFDDGELTLAVIDTGGMRHVGYAQDFYGRAFPNRKDPYRIHLRQKDSFILETKDKATGEWEIKELASSEGYEDTTKKIHPIHRPLHDGICSPYQTDISIKERDMVEPDTIKDIIKNPYILTIDDSIISGQSHIGTLINLINQKSQLGFEKLFSYVNRDEQGRVANLVRDGRGDGDMNIYKLLLFRAPMEFEMFYNNKSIFCISNFMPDIEEESMENGILRAKVFAELGRMML